MHKAQTRQSGRERRHKRIRAKVKGTATRPRLSIFKSNRALYAQLIDDDKAVTLAAATSKGMKGKSMMTGAKEVGTLIAKAGKAKGIGKVVFDRGGFTYAGVIRTLADAAREGGLKF